MSKKVALTTFGCRANQYDSAVLADLLKKASFDLVDFEEKADIYIINSCTVTSEANREARQFVRRARRLNPKAITIVTGCAAQANPEMFKELEGVHYVVGNSTKGEIISLIRDHSNVILSETKNPVGSSGSLPCRQAGFAFQTQDDRRVGAIHPPLKHWRTGELPIQKEKFFFGGGVTLPEHSRSFLKIQDGCSQFCSFCIVPFARGPNRSVEPSKVIDSMFELKEKGVHEVVLTGIHLGTYGKDLKPKITIEDILSRIEREKPVHRVRLSSIDPEEISNRLIELISNSDIFCPHLHIPLQSGDDKILKKMKRRYTSDYFQNLSEKLISRIPNLCLGTDLIVGFPGEGENEFQNSVKLIEDSPLSYVHVFPYSKRKGTKAASFESQVESNLKKKRCRIIRKISEEKRYQFHQSQLGQTFEVILERRKRGLVGMTRNYISVDIEGESDYSPNSLIDARIESVSRRGVAGVVVMG